MSEKERRLQLLGSDIRLLLGQGPRPDEDLRRAENFLRQMQNRLSRFVPSSELQELNNSHQEEVPISPLLRDNIRAALQAAELSGGLLDPTLLPEIRRSGYDSSWQRGRALSLQEALRLAPDPDPASPKKGALWKEIVLSEDSVWRPPGVQIDLGGVGKGFAADHLAKWFAPYTSWCADIGGDMRLGGTLCADRQVTIPSPFGDDLRFSLAEGAVATSGIWRRIWKQDGKVRHHLLNPANGEPVWSGVLQATALAPLSIDAERLAKTVLLLGTSAAPLLEKSGGALLLQSGEWMVIGDGISS